MKFIRRIWNEWTDYRAFKRTGRNRQEREYDAWVAERVSRSATPIRKMFHGFKHVITVDPDKFLDPHEPFGWYPIPEARQYFWPQAELGTNAVWSVERVIWDKWDNDWHVNGIGDEDLIFVATNSDADALMITLRYK